MLAGQRISHYEILGPLGEGGMGEIYKAEDTLLHRQVALKFLPDEMVTDSGAKRRFFREAQAASALDHPNICNIHEIDETTDGQVFICMASYEGQTLEEKLEDGPLGFEEALDIARQVAMGLSEAHRAGIIHRDIKPANILITRHGVVKILDFGLAKLEHGTKLTKTGIPLGTPAYMSPEQLLGEPLNPQTDIWSFGLVLYEMLTGGNPFMHQYEQATVYHIMNTDPGPVTLLREGIPRCLVEVCDKCLTKDRTERYRTFDEVLSCLQQTKSGSKPSVVSVWRKPSRQLIGILLLSFAVIAVLYYLGISGIDRQEPRADPGEFGTWKLGVGQYELAPKDQVPEDDLSLLQALIVQHLTGVPEVGVIPSQEFNNYIKTAGGGLSGSQEANLYQQIFQDVNMDFLIRGSVFYSAGQYFIQTRLIQLSPWKILHTVSTTLDDLGGPNISAAAADIAGKMYKFLQTKILYRGEEGDIQPWLRLRAPVNYDAVRAFLQAKESVYRSDPGNAIAYLRKAIEFDSTFIAPRVWLLQGQAFRGDYLAAQSNYKAMLRHSENASLFEEQLIQLANAYIRGDPAKQVEHLKAALNYSPKNNILLFELARTYYEMREFGQASERINETISMRYQYYQAYQLAAECYIQLGRYEKALAVLQQSPVTPGQGGAGILLLQSIIHYLQGDSTSSQMYRTQYIRLQRNYGVTEDRIHYDFAAVYHEFGVSDLSEREYLTAISLNPRIPAYHRELADLYIVKRDTDSAIHEYADCLSMNSSDLRALSNLGKLYQSRQEDEKAMILYERYLAQDTLSAEAKRIERTMHRIKS